MSLPLSCCSIADCRPTDFRTRGTHYEAMIDGEWREIPPQTVLQQIESFTTIGSQRNQVAFRFEQTLQIAANVDIVFDQKNFGFSRICFHGCRCGRGGRRFLRDGRAGGFCGILE